MTSAVSAPADLVRSYLSTGRNGGAWTGAGVTSSAAQADPNHATAVGYAEASQLLGLTGPQTATWAGLPVDATTLLLRYTYYGDLNLDGRVGADDYALLDRGFGAHRSGWVNGDVNYDGTVDAADYLLTDRSYALNGSRLTPGFLAAREAQFGPAYIAALEHAVPEPSVVALLTMAAVVHMRRRSR